MKKIISYSIILVLVWGAITACGNKKPKSEKWQDTSTSGLIQVAIDDSFEPVFDSQIAVFETIYKQAGIIPIYTDEIDALQMLYDDSVRLAIVTRELDDREKEAYLAKKRIPRAIHIATDAIALITHKDNPDTLMSVHTLKDILTGKITHWNQINPKTHLKGEINVVFDHERSGILRYMVDSICKGEAIGGNIYAQKRNKEVVEYVAESPHALGLIGVNWVGNEDDTTNMSFHKRVNVLGVSRLEHPNPENSYQPYQAWIALRTYPLLRNVYAIVNDPKSGLSNGFASFLYAQRGQYIFMKSGMLSATQQVRIIENR